VCEEIECEEISLAEEEESSLVLRPRARLLKEADANSSFLLSCVKARTTRYVMRGLKVEGDRIQQPIILRAVEHLRHHVSTTIWERRKLDGVHFEC